MNIPCPPWCDQHDYSDGEPIHQHRVLDDDLDGVEVWAASWQPTPVAAVMLSDEGDRLERLDAGELRRLACAFLRAADLIDRRPLRGS